MQNTPKITVILPTYNGIEYLKYSVESVLQQSLKEFEFIILDDCSPDERTWEYLSSLNDDRIQLYRNETNKGLFFNLNFLAKKATAPLIKLWSHDDYMCPNALEEIVKFHDENKSVGFSYTSVKILDKDNNIIEDEKDDDTPKIVDQLKHAQVCFSFGSIAGNIANVTITKEAYNKVGDFDEAMKICGDFDMWVRIAEYYDVGFLKNPVIYLRRHKGQLSFQSKYYINHIKEDAEVYKKLFAYLPDDVVAKGKKDMRRTKLLFYYKLMLHELRKGKIKSFFNFYAAISELESPIKLTYYFLLKMLRLV